MNKPTSDDALSDVNTCTACDPSKVVLYGICPECFKEGYPTLSDVGITHAPESKYNLLIEILKKFPKVRVEVIPDEPKDQKVADQMTKLLNSKKE